MESAATRSLRVLSLFQTGRAWSARELAQRLGVAQRTVRRDVARLRSLGYDIRSAPGPGGAYRLVPGVKIPPLLLDADEVCSLVTGLLVLQAGTQDTTAAQVCAKLEQLLPHALRRRAAATAMATQVLAPAAPAADWSSIGTLAEAIADGRRVRFTYADRNGRISERTVRPHRHVIRDGAWYLVAHDLQREDWRLFRLDRISDLTVDATSPVADPLDFPQESIEGWLASDFGREPGPDA